ncbi:MAG: alpha/beta hydrolase [Terracidiphilus sp.]
MIVNGAIFAVLRNFGTLALFCCLPGGILSQTGNTAAVEPEPAFADSSPHRVQMVTVEKDVRLEVLDWGGTGRPVVLLAGSGNTAHIYDDFAPRLAEKYRVYGVTRRGSGASSAPSSGYSARRLGDDVLAVLEALKLDKPVLVGHSFAGQEVSSIATRFPGRIGGAVYLDAAYGYAFYAPSVGELSFDLPELQKKLEQFNQSQGDAKLIDELLQTELPAMEKDLARKKQFNDLISQVPPGQGHPAAADMASFTKLRAWYALNMVGGNPPEVELHWSFESNPDGSVGKFRPHPAVSPEDAKWEKFTRFQIPVLAIYACPVDYGPLIDNNQALRGKLEAYNSTDCQARAKALEEDSPGSRAVLWPRVYHYLFIARPEETLKEMRAFIDSLPQ